MSSQETMSLQISIPTDVLCVIFDILRGSNRKSDKPSSNFNQSLCWVSEVTHVCSSWREAALSVNFLWTHIQIDASISWAVEFARRSGKAPLHIALCCTGYLEAGDIDCMKNLLRENRQRIQGICLEGIHEWDEDEIFDALSGATDAGDTDAGDTDALSDRGSALYPILDDVEISLYDDYSFFLPHELLHAPQLKNLSLQYCAIPDQSGTFHNLSYLCIRETSESCSSTPFLSRALSDMPNLEILDLTLVRGEIDETSTINFGTQLVTLPKLYRIKINGWPIKWVVPFLQMISPGPKRTVWVSHIPVDGIKPLLLLFACIMSHTIESSSMHRLMLDFNTADALVCASQGRPTLCDDYNIGLTVDILRPDIWKRRRNGFNPTHSLLDGLLRRMNHQDLQILDLFHSCPLSTQLWVKFFGQLPSLASIGIASGAPHLFAALIDGSEDVPVKTNVTVALPFQALREVRVEIGRSGMYADKDMECMLECLRKRMDLGVTLRKLSFMGAFPEPDLVNAFRGVVTQVEVSTKFIQFIGG